MSPLWRDRLQVLLEPGRLRIRRLHRGLRPRAGAVDTLVGSSAGAAADAADSPAVGPASLADWRAPLARLEALADDGAWRGAEVQVVLAGAFVRYRLVPGDAQLVSAAEREVCARHLFRQTYGALVDAWRVQVADAGPGRAAVAAAVDAALVDGLLAACAAGGARLRRVEPYLAPVANRLRRGLGRGSAWLAIAEPERLCLAQLEDGAWASVHVQRLVGPLADELLAALARQACAGVGAASGAAGGGVVHVFAPNQESLAWSADTAWTPQLLAPRDPEFPQWP